MAGKLALVCLTLFLGLASCSGGEPNQIRLFESEAGPPVEQSCAPGIVCATPTPYCRGDVCVACLTDANCGNKFCHPSSFTCVDCVTSGDCKNDKPYCFANQCRECLVRENCGDATLSCDTRTGKCEPACDGDAGCMAPNGICAVDMAICVACGTDADCPMDHPRCEDNRCVECTTATDCDELEPICDLDKLECVECLADSDCDEGVVCDKRKCAP